MEYLFIALYPRLFTWCTLGLENPSPVMCNGLTHNWKALVTTPNLVNAYSLPKALQSLSDIRNRPHPCPTSMDGHPQSLRTRRAQPRTFPGSGAHPTSKLLPEPFPEQLRSSAPCVGLSRFPLRSQASRGYPRACLTPPDHPRFIHPYYSPLPPGLSRLLYAVSIPLSLSSWTSPASVHLAQVFLIPLSTTTRRPKPWSSPVLLDWTLAY